MKYRCGLNCRLSVAVWMCAAAAGFGQDRPGPRAERLKYDTERGGWVALLAPVAGTDAGDLAFARASLAAEEYARAQRQVRRWLKTYGTGSVLYPHALLLRAQIEKARRSYYVAYATLTELLDAYGATEIADDAAVEMFNIGEVYLSGVRRKFWGMRLLRATDLGLDILDDVAVRFPDTSLAEQAIKTKGDYFFKEGDFGLAELEYNRLATSYAQSRYRRYAMRRSADSALASFGGVRFDDAPLIEAEERYRQYAAEYRGLAEQERVGLILEDILERRAAKEFDVGGYYEKTVHPRAAAFYYRSTIEHWPDTIASRKARAALGAMGEEAPEADVAAGAMVGSEDRS